MPTLEARTHLVWAQMSVKVRSDISFWVQTTVWSEFHQNRTRAADSALPALGAFTLKPFRHHFRRALQSNPIIRSDVRASEQDALVPW